MILMHSRPSSISAALVGTGASFLTSATRLFDGKPQRTCRIAWLSAGSPAITDYVALQLTWATAQVIRGAHIGGLVNLPAGLKVEIRGKRAADAGFTYALGGNALTQLVAAQADGELACHWLFDDGLDALVGVEVRIFNDVGSSTVLTADDYIEIGECFLGTGAEWPIRNDLGDQQNDPSLWMESVGQQQFEVPRRTYREMVLDIVAQTWDRAYGDSDSLQALRATLAGGGDVLVYPALREAGQGASAAVDYATITRQAVFGKVRRLGQLQAAGGGHAWGLAIGVRQSPA